MHFPKNIWSSILDSKEIGSMLKKNLNRKPLKVKKMSEVAGKITKHFEKELPDVDFEKELSDVEYKCEKLLSVSYNNSQIHIQKNLIANIK